MKKKCLLWLIFLLLPLVVALSACKREPPEEHTPGEAIENIKTPPATPVLRLTMSTGVTTGYYYPFGAALAKAVDESSDYLVIDVQSSEDSAENIEHIASGEAHLALLPNDILSYAFFATDTCQDKQPVSNIAPLMTLYPEICQVVVGANSGILSVEELKGRRVAIGEDETAIQASALKILAEYGLTEENIEALHIGFAEAALAMQEKTIDAFFVTVGTPNKAMMDLQAEREITVLGLDEEIIVSLLEKYPFYTVYTMDENDYSFLTKPLNTVAVRATLVTSTSLSEQAAYDIVKTIIENSDKIAMTHAKGMYINAEEAVSGLPLELHPGARRYFEEIRAFDPPPEASGEDVEEEGTRE